jgi:hypothetical protein
MNVLKAVGARILSPGPGECLELVVSLLQIIDKFFKFDRVRQNLFGCRLQFINIGQFNLG